jgi:hypothetical protein
MDRASQALTLKLPPGVPDTYAVRAEHTQAPLSTVYHRRNGRQSIKEKAQKQQYLTPCEETAVVRFILQMEDLGQPVRQKYIRTLAFRVAFRRSITDRPSKPPGKNWVQAFKQRHPELTARRVQALDWNRYNIYEKIVHWFAVIGKELHKPDIKPENVWNMDETGVMLSKLNSVKVLVSKDEQRNYRGARVNRTTITAIECISASGRCLDPMIIWPALSHRANWVTHPTPGWHYACSEAGYTDSEISLEWIKRVFEPQTRAIANNRPRLLLWDGFGTHESAEVLEFCLDNNIIPCRLPSHTSHKLQPCDVGVFSALKSAYRDQVEQMERAGVGTIGKQHFTYLYEPARKKAITPRNIMAGFRGSGLFPFDPDRVLADVPKPPAKLTIPESNEVGPDTQDKVLQHPSTPITPVTAKYLTSLQSLIEQNANELSETSKKDLKKYLGKVINAAKISFAEQALLRDRARFLFKMNNEAKVRRATKSIMLGKAKVMSFEDLELARAKRAAKEQAKATGSRKRKRKDAPESSMSEPKGKVARTCGSPDSVSP